MNNVEDISDLYADISACLLAISNALEKRGALTKKELTEAAQERLLTLTVDFHQENPYHLLRALAAGLPPTQD